MAHQYLDSSIVEIIREACLTGAPAPTNVGIAQQLDGRETSISQIVRRLAREGHFAIHYVSPTTRFFEMDGKKSAPTFRPTTPFNTASPRRGERLAPGHLMTASEIARLYRGRLYNDIRAQEWRPEPAMMEAAE